MQVSLRQRRQYGWRGMGDGGSGETDTEGSALPGDIDFSSGETDPSAYYPAPGYNIETAPGPVLAPDELAAEQARAQDWLKQLPNIINVAGKITMSASQLAAGIQAGMVKPSTTCPSGYLVGTECVAPVAQPAASASLVPGLPNSTLAMIGGGLLILVLISRGGKR